MCELPNVALSGTVGDYLDTILDKDPILAKGEHQDDTVAETLDMEQMSKDAEIIIQKAAAAINIQSSPEGEETHPGNPGEVHVLVNSLFMPICMASIHDEIRTTSLHIVCLIDRLCMVSLCTHAQATKMFAHTPALITSWVQWQCRVYWRPVLHACAVHVRALLSPWPQQVDEDAALGNLRAAVASGKMATRGDHETKMRLRNRHRRKLPA